MLWLGLRREKMGRPKGSKNKIQKGFYVKCQQCNGSFYTCKSILQTGRDKFCSKRCYSISQKGWEPWNKGLKKSGMSGKHHTKESKEKTRATLVQKKGGITPLHLLIRTSLENDLWIKQVFERDNYTCQECNQRGGNLEAHHKKDFAIILKEFLDEYDQFSPIEDKETLLRLAFKYKPFWDIDNGETLCGGCHDLIKIKRRKIR